MKNNNTTYWFTADQHYGHFNVIKYSSRPYSSVEEMDNDLIKRHNQVVRPNDIVVHAGDFTLGNKEKAVGYIKRLNGSHIFLRGSHDRWMGRNGHEIWEKRIGKTYIVVCHYAMRVWPRSHYGSIQLFAHSHGNLLPFGNQYDIGVDNNNYFPVTVEDVLQKIEERRNEIMYDNGIL